MTFLYLLIILACPFVAWGQTGDIHPLLNPNRFVTSLESNAALAFDPSTNDIYLDYWAIDNAFSLAWKRGAIRVKTHHSNRDYHGYRFSSIRNFDLSYMQAFDKGIFGGKSTKLALSYRHTISDANALYHQFLGFNELNFNYQVEFEAKRGSFYPYINVLYRWAPYKTEHPSGSPIFYETKFRGSELGLQWIRALNSKLYYSATIQYQYLQIMDYHYHDYRFPNPISTGAKEEVKALHACLLQSSFNWIVAQYFALGFDISAYNEVLFNRFFWENDWQIMAALRLTLFLPDQENSISLRR